MAAESEQDPHSRRRGHRDRDPLATGRQLSGEAIGRRAAFWVREVKALAQDIPVRSLFPAEIDDDVAREARQSLERAVNIPGTVQVSMTAHEITPSGDVPSMLQSEAASRAMHDIKGATNVVNKIRINSNPMTSGVKDAIIEVLLRNAELEGKHIQVTTSGDGTITLAGSVRTWAEREQAEKICWSAPGWP